MMSLSLQVKNENDFVVYIGKYMRSRNRNLEFYPIVKKISRNVEVTPDIDLLCIDKINQTTIGCEAKIIGYRRRWKRYAYDAIYRGIGQALLYNLYGIEKTQLVFAFMSNDDTPRAAIEKLKRKFDDVKKTFIGFNINYKLGLKLMLFTETRVHLWNLIKVESISTFQRVKDFNFRKACLLKGEFTWNNKLKTNIYDDTVEFKYPIEMGSDCV